jgi:hypothetical protein
LSSSFIREFSHLWTGGLAHYQAHRNDEHLNALYEDSLRFVGLHLENDLCRSEYWSRVSLRRRVAVLLFLVDRGVVERSLRHGRHVYAPLPHAEQWVANQSAMRPFLKPTLELVAALRHEQARRSRSRKA